MPDIDPDTAPPNFPLMERGAFWQCVKGAFKLIPVRKIFHRLAFVGERGNGTPLKTASEP